MIKEAIMRLSQKENLSFDEAYAVMDEIMQGNASDVQMSAYLTALALKGETIDEITASAASMRTHCIKLLHDLDALEIVGTGGDRSNSFNISTTASLVISAGGVPVAKHGNRAASSKSGSADVLEALGVNINTTPERSAQLLNDIGICFLFAQNYHIAMKYVAPVRKELAIRTIFNILGPLSNPAGASMQVMGVYDESLVEPLAQVLANLGVKRALVIYGQDRLDEISMCAPTSVCEVKNGAYSSYVIRPEDFGLKSCDSGALTGGTPEENAVITRNVLAGTAGPHRDAVVLNAGAALYVADKAATIEEGVRLAEALIDSGAALEQLERFVLLSNESEPATILDEIASSTKQRIARAKELVPLTELQAQARALPSRNYFPFEEALRRPGVSLICEVKKASPSKGCFSDHYRPADIAREYELGGAAAISCLTEPAYFLGSNEDLTAVSKAVSIPVLRKDFTVDPYMIYESKLLGADAILLICSLLTDNELASYIDLAHTLGLSALVEAHTAHEVDRALLAGARIIGVNNRNLATFETNPANSISLREIAGHQVLYVAESGIQSVTDVEQLAQAKVDAALIGEACMTANNKVSFVAQLKEAGSV